MRPPFTSSLPTVLEEIAGQAPLPRWLAAGAGRISPAAATVGDVMTSTPPLPSATAGQSQC